jgi:HSP20 family molecular chaperone IbpA
MTDEKDRGLFERINAAIDLYNRNETEIMDILGVSSNRVEKMNRLAEVHWEDEKVTVVLDNVSISHGISMSESEDGDQKLLVIEIAEDKIEVEVPDGIDFEKKDVTIKNGVMTVELPRGEE